MTKKGHQCTLNTMRTKKGIRILAKKIQWDVEYYELGHLLNPTLTTA